MWAFEASQTRDDSPDRITEDQEHVGHYDYKARMIFLERKLNVVMIVVRRILLNLRIIAPRRACKQVPEQINTK